MDKHTRFALSVIAVPVSVVSEASEGLIGYWLWQQWLVPLGLPSLKGAAHAWIVMGIAQAIVGFPHLSVKLHILELVTLKSSDEDRLVANLSRLGLMILTWWATYGLISLMGHLFVSAAR